MAGVIAAGSPHTAEAGERILKVGGNAVDAAVAAAFTSFVSEVTVVNLGGGGFANVHVPGDAGGRVLTYDFFSDMPSGTMSPNLDFYEITIDFGDAVQPFFIGRGSSAVPGSVAGLCRLARDHGSLPLSDLLQPAVDLARNGYAVSPLQEKIFQMLGSIFSATPESRKIFQPQGHLLRAGEHVSFPQLAESLALLGRHGVDWFYKGEMARLLVADHQTHGGLITAEDLANYQVHVREPLRVSYHGSEIFLPPPPSTGGVLIAFAMHLMQSLSFKDQVPGNTNHIEALANVMWFTSAARKHWEADHRSTAAKLKHFLSDAFIDPYIRQLHDVLSGQPLPRTVLEGKGPRNTTHISAVDDSGLTVAITTSAGEGAGYLLGESGVMMNNMLGEHDLNPNGFHRHSPGARLNSMMSPAVVLREGKPMMAVGSAGSNRLRSAIMQTISGVLDFDLTFADSIERSRVHFEDGVLHLEGPLENPPVAELAERGFKVNLWRDHSLFFGGAQAAGSYHGKLAGAADPRRNGAVRYVF